MVDSKFDGFIQNNHSPAYGQGQVQTDRKSGVNLIPAATDAALLAAQIDTCIALRVPVVCLFWELSAGVLRHLREAGVIMVCQVGSVQEAREADVAAVMSLGAQGAVLGTAMIATHESFCARCAPQRIAAAGADETTLTETFHINWPPHVRVRLHRIAAETVAALRVAECNATSDEGP